MNEYHAAIVSAGVDYLTLTATATHNQAALWEHGSDFISARVDDQGAEVRPAEVMGYRGFQVEGVMLGKRDDSVMLRASSSHADDLWRFMLERERCWNVRRIDAQVTGQFADDREGYGREVEAQALAFRARQKTATHGKVETHRGNGRGDSCTIGSRSSNRYLRCYDKTREQRGEIDVGIWRWEVEYKAELAAKVAEQIACNQTHRHAIIGLVETEFKRKGVNVPWQTGEVVSIPIVGLEKTDDERRLRWLITQVKPVVGKLVNVYGQDVVLSALGLDAAIVAEKA